MSDDVNCSKSGYCQRVDGFQLLPGFQPIRKKVITYDSSMFQSKIIYSEDTFANSKSLSFLAGSNKYVCADGFSECFNSCCSRGLCIDPSNKCLQFKGLSDRMIYIPSIFFAILAVIYWFLFIRAGIRYNNKKNAVIVIKNDDRENKDKGLNNFESEDFNSENRWGVFGNPPIESKNEKPVPSVTDHDIISVNPKLDNLKVFTSSSIYRPQANKSKNIFNAEVIN